MVGVAGRSKGCVTCRKRKKGCDLKQPACSQCSGRGITCVYDTDRNFIYHDTFKKRQNSQHGILSASSSENGSPLAAEPPDVEASTQMISITSRNKESHVTTSLPWSSLLPPHLVQSAYGARTLEAFMDLYVPQGDLRRIHTEGKNFVDVTPRLTAHDEALRLTVLAIGTVALSRQVNDADLARQGRTIYTKALFETRRALQDPARARSTAVLVIPRIMAIFEILFGAESNTSSQANSWLSHAEGELALIVARGPAAYSQDDAAHALFVAARFRPLIAAVRTRTRTVLNERRWKTLPWKGRVRTPNDSLLDILAAIPEILENVDRWGTLSPDTIENQARDLETSAKCWTLHIRLQEWLALHENEFREPVTRTPTPITFPNFEVAVLTIRYWVTCLLLYTTLDTASRVPPINDGTAHPDRPHPRHYARLIARSASYFFRKEFGATGATSIAFPIGNALLFMKRNPAVDGPYMGLIMKAWSSPDLPNAIKNFLDSLHNSVHKAPARYIEGAKVL